MSHSASLLALALVLVALAAPAGAIVIINNGLAPPNPANVIDGDLGPGDVFVQNVGCDFTVQQPCPMPWGDPTSVELVSGGSVSGLLFVLESSTITMNGGSAGRSLSTLESSTVTMNGGSVGDELDALGSSTITMNGGSVGSFLAAFGSSTITMSGGTVGSFLLAHDSSTILIVGIDFAVDGNPVGYGPIAAMDGTLTGRLKTLELIDNFFCHDGSTACSGTSNGLITLVEAVPEPSTALLLCLGLVSLATVRGGVEIQG